MVVVAPAAPRRDGLVNIEDPHFAVAVEVGDRRRSQLGCYAAVAFAEEAVGEVEIVLERSLFGVVPEHSLFEIVTFFDREESELCREFVGRFLAGFFRHCGRLASRSDHAS